MPVIVGIKLCTYVHLVIHIIYTCAPDFYICVLYCTFVIRCCYDCNPDIIVHVAVQTVLLLIYMYK